MLFTFQWIRESMTNTAIKSNLTEFEQTQKTIWSISLAYFGFDMEFPSRNCFAWIVERLCHLYQNPPAISVLSLRSIAIVCNICNRNTQSTELKSKIPIPKIATKHRIYNKYYPEKFIKINMKTIKKKLISILLFYFLYDTIFLHFICFGFCRIEKREKNNFCHFFSSYVLVGNGHAIVIFVCARFFLSINVAAGMKLEQYFDIISGEFVHCKRPIKTSLDHMSSG